MRVTKSTLFVLVLLFSIGAQLVYTQQGRCAPFTPGNLVIYRVGDGHQQSDKGMSNAIFLDEYNTDGTLVQSIAVPATGSNQMTASMTATSEGFISLSTDGKYLMFTGYRAPIDIAKIADSDAATYARVVGSIDLSGNVLTRALGSLTFSKNNIRSAASTNGSDVWVSGSAGGSGLGGVFYLSFGGTGVTQLSTTFTTARQLEIFDGQLYASSTKTSYCGVSTVGTGLPMTTGQTVTRLTGLTDTSNLSDYAFFMADLDANVAGLDTLYIADDDATYGGLNKYSLIGGTWTWNGEVGSAANTYRGLTGVVSGNSVTLYATRKGGDGKSGGGELVTVTDTSGYNGTFSNDHYSVTELAKAADYTAFRGVAFVPVPELSAIILLFTGVFAGLGYLRLRRK
jgi:hypothetical protein